METVKGLQDKGLPTIGPKIIEFHPVVTPTAMGQIGTQIYGLGDDSKIYLYDFKAQKWVEFKG